MDTLTRIRAFIAVIENEGFSAAARKTGRSKALLSKYVRELDDEIGVIQSGRVGNVMVVLKGDAYLFA